MCITVDSEIFTALLSGCSQNHETIHTSSQVSRSTVNEEEVIVGAVLDGLRCPQDILHIEVVDNLIFLIHGS
jgi:hypothetical protein